MSSDESYSPFENINAQRADDSANDDDDKDDDDDSVDLVDPQNNQDAVPTMIDVQHDPPTRKDWERIAPINPARPPPPMRHHDLYFEVPAAGTSPSPNSDALSDPSLDSVFCLKRAGVKRGVYCTKNQHKVHHYEMPRPKLSYAKKRCSKKRLPFQEIEPERHLQTWVDSKNDFYIITQLGPGEAGGVMDGLLDKLNIEEIGKDLLRRHTGSKIELIKASKRGNRAVNLGFTGNQSSTRDRGGIYSCQLSPGTLRYNPAFEAGTDLSKEMHQRAGIEFTIDNARQTAFAAEIHEKNVFEALTVAAFLSDHKDLAIQDTIHEMLGKHCDIGNGRKDSRSMVAWDTFLDKDINRFVTYFLSFSQRHSVKCYIEKKNAMEKAMEGLYDKYQKTFEHLRHVTKETICPRGAPDGFLKLDIH